MGRIHASKGNREAYGAMVTNPSFSLMTRIALVQLLPHDVAEHAALFVVVVLLGAVQLLPHPLGDDGGRDELGVRMLQRCAGRPARVLEDEDVSKPRILLEVQDAVVERPQDVLDPPLAHAGEGLAVLGRLDDDLVGADAVHLVVHAVALAVQIALDLERRELVRHHPQLPVRTHWRAEPSGR